MDAARNMTWGGKQGFQTPIVDQTFNFSNYGIYGNQHVERGLACKSFIVHWGLRPRYQMAHW